eukprot:scaffold2828_cov126-Cylindrotheca_fusiformis.AAC.1
MESKTKCTISFDDNLRHGMFVAFQGMETSNEKGQSVDTWEWLSGTCVKRQRKDRNLVSMIARSYVKKARGNRRPWLVS